MPQLTEALRRHIAYYAAVTAHAETRYLEGGDSITRGLALFDHERLQIRAAWKHLLHQIGSPEHDELLLFFANATAYVGTYDSIFPVSAYLSSRACLEQLDACAIRPPKPLLSAM